MANSNYQGFERVEQARERLDQALVDLEQVINDKAAQAATAGKKTSTDVEVLKAENARLKSLADDISTRLDATIERLHGLLKG